MLTSQVWRYLELVCREGEDSLGETSDAIAAVWPDRHQAARELFFAVEQVAKCAEEEKAAQKLIDASAPYLVSILPFEEGFGCMKQILKTGLQEISKETLDLTQDLFPEAEIFRQIEIVFVWGFLGKKACRFLPDLLEIFDSREQIDEEIGLRCAAAYAIGKIGEATDAAIETLSRTARSGGEEQPVRSYCIEALMDLGSAAAAATPVLESIFHNESEDEDLRTFAWAALKSVTAYSDEHGCGGTVAEHMRSLYTTRTESGECE